jgi:hypothetical protein
MVERPGLGIDLEFSDRSGRLMDFIDESNQIDPRDSMLFSEVVLWSYGVPVENVFQIIREAREDVANRLELISVPTTSRGRPGSSHDDLLVSICTRD